MIEGLDFLLKTPKVGPVGNIQSNILGSTRMSAKGMLFHIA